MTKTVMTLIIINVGVFLFINIFRNFSSKYIELVAMVPQLIVKKFMVWQFVTYMFVHENFVHLLVNMLMLWFFGPSLERAWGRKQFLTYYFFAGIGGAVCSFIFSYNSSIIGASAAIFGLLVAYAIMFPETIVLVFFIFPMKIKYAVLLFAGIDLWGAWQGSTGGVQSGIAHLAHLGGALFGYLYLKNEWIRRQLAYLNLGSFKDRQSRRRRHRTMSSQAEFNREVDRILDKISKQGMKSLTRRERKVLEKKSKPHP